jgi:hypothetical protein
LGAINTKDAYYFPHDSNAKDDPKCILLIEQLGLEGYGIFWVLIETLRDQPEYKYPLKLLPALARRFNTTIDKMKLVVCNYGLFQVEDDEFFFSDSLMRRMEVLEAKRESQRLKALKRWGKDAVALPEHEPCTSLVMPVKKRKVKESKVNNYSSSHMTMAEKLKSFILANNPGAKTPDDLSKWAADFERMERIDKRSLEQIEAVMEFSQKDSFWKSNILSAAKFREKFDTLILQKDRSKGKQQSGPANKGNFEQRQYSDAEIERLYKV